MELLRDAGALRLHQGKGLRRPGTCPALGRIDSEEEDHGGRRETNPTGKERRIDRDERP